MGTVFEAFDRELGTACALKLLSRTTPRGLLSFKREFRVLQGLRHANLLQLGELLNEHEHWFFTMELVEGVDLLTHVCGDAGPGALTDQPATLTMDETSSPVHAELHSSSSLRSFDEARLFASLAQLADGLRFLHESHKVHRDVKPSNVMVTPQGRVVILDFGLVADRARLDAVDPIRRTQSGTPGYMAPEQILDAPMGPAADLYAMGVVLFRALTGTFPSSDSSVISSLLGGATTPTRPSSFVSGVPPVLDDLCVELLRPDPRLRPTARQVLARLGARESKRQPEPSQSFVGRTSELEQIMAAYHDSRRRQVTVAIEGPSGIGKTALLAELQSRLGGCADPPLILRGRCYESEAIPYKAIDGVMDELGDTLAVAERGVLDALPANLSLLSVLFPALKRVPAFTHGESPERGDPYAMRREAEAVGRAVMAALAARRPLVIVIDDFQWSDSDSLTFLAALAHPPEAPPFLLIISSRASHELTFATEVRRISLAPLPLAEARELATRLLRATGSATTASAEEIADEAAGHPFFLSELAWRTTDRCGMRLDDVLWDRISACSTPARQVLELLAVTATPIAQRVIAEAAALDAGAFLRAAHDLRAERLIRTGGMRLEDEVETGHDRIRETVMARLAPALRSERHLRLAMVLEQACPDEFDLLVTHFEGGGDLARAAGYAVRAGDQAARALAFERAAAFYRRAIAGLSSETTRAQQLRVKLADALANAGLGREAAHEYQGAARECAPALAVELQRRAAEHLLRSGRIDEGSTLLTASLARVGVHMPRTPLLALASLVFYRARVRVRGLHSTERQAHSLDELDLLRVDTLWTAAARLGPTDPIRAAQLQARHLLCALELGEPLRIARALLAEATFESMGGPARARGVEDLLKRARPVVATVEEPYARAMLAFTEGFRDFQFGCFPNALTTLTHAADLLEQTCVGANHDAAVTKRFILDSLYNLGELGEMSRRAPLLLEDAERRGDLYQAAELRTGLPNAVWLCRDQPDEAERANRLGITPWSRRGFFLQHYYYALAQGNILLYRQEGANAFRGVEQVWRSLRLSLLMRIQAVRAEALFLRARAAVADGSERALAIATRAAARLACEAVPSAIGLAAAAQAGIAARRGDPERAIERLRAAERALAQSRNGMVSAACRFHLARATGTSIVEAETWMTSRGVSRPDRFAHLLVPGVATIYGVEAGRRSRAWS